MVLMLVKKSQGLYQKKFFQQVYIINYTCLTIKLLFTAMDMVQVYVYIISLMVVFLATAVISSATAMAINCCFFKKKLALSKKKTVHVEMSENVAYATVK